MKIYYPIFLFSLMALLVDPGPASARPHTAVVQAVLFYSPNCGHCYYVITEVLPPIFEEYGDRLEMIGVDITGPEGQTAFLAALEMHGIAREHGGVPFLVIGDSCLMGDVDIPQQFPVLIEYHLARGGVGWPPIPGLAEMIAGMEATQQAQSTPTPEQTATPGSTATPEALILTGEERAGVADRLAQDPAGNGLAILVLVGMLAASGWSAWRLLQPSDPRANPAGRWLIPLLCIAGLGVAGYLSYIEITRVEAICGPVGDCNTVQQSRYARLCGILPIGVLGMAGYVAILAAWLFAASRNGKLAGLAAGAQLTMTVFGTLFSIYLTFLEPFVIGATCVWCLTSAIIMTVLMLFSLAPGKRSLDRLVLTLKASRSILPGGRRAS